MDKIFPRSFPWDWAKTPVRQRMCASHLCAFSREPPLVFCHDTPAPVIAGPEASTGWGVRAPAAKSGCLSAVKRIEQQQCKFEEECFIR